MLDNKINLGLILADISGKNLLSKPCYESNYPNLFGLESLHLRIVCYLFHKVKKYFKIFLKTILTLNILYVIISYRIKVKFI